MADVWCAGLHWLPISVIVILPLTFLTTFALAVCLGHVEPDFPYISDTGAIPPESCIFGQFLNITAVLIGLTFYVRYKQVEEHFQHQMRREGRYTKINKFSLILGLLSALGISIVGNFQETNVLIVHLSGAVMAFGLGCLYIWLHTYLSFKLCPHLNPKSVAVFRLLIALVSSVCFVLMFALVHPANEAFTGDDYFRWQPEDGGFAYHVMSTSCEWTMATMFLLFFTTYIPEFHRLSVAPVQIAFMIQNDEAGSGIFRNDDDIIT